MKLGLVEEKVDVDGLYVKNKTANLISLTIFRVIWNERNSRVFDNIESSILSIKDR